MDPWYDYLAIPVAPGVLLAQFLALLVPRRWRLAIVGAGTLAIAAMFVFILLKSRPHDANIGAGVLLLWFLFSLLPLGVALGNHGSRRSRPR